MIENQYPEDFQKEIEPLRRKIDSVDKKILDAIAERFLLVKKVGTLKAKYKIPPLQKARWQEVLRRNIEYGKSLSLNEDFVKDIYERFHKEALEIEEKNK